MIRTPLMDRRLSKFLLGWVSEVVVSSISYVHPENLGMKNIYNV